ncbi:flagellar hook-basal body complex protein FliE [Myxococcota bacterium]|nr:flagellar hook-basal body complex protein FliE [Myxococcota bacterium]MBU1379833.1 flagellar hook-basal body complex protein FliE [Myxococcota bacterium]MBU1496501.1 flagellar hook-basal body complex protein FliE [Myxococcota bacterium]
MTMQINTYGPVPLMKSMRVGEDMKISLPPAGNSDVPNVDGEFARMLGINESGDKSQALLDTAVDNVVDGVARVNEKQTISHVNAEEFSAGKREKIHETMIDLEQADISLRFLGSVRSRMLEAYQEIMRINV